MFKNVEDDMPVKVNYNVTYLKNAVRNKNFPFQLKSIVYLVLSCNYEEMFFSFWLG